MDETSDRLKFPYLAAGQAQKEVTHNEALALADILIQPVVQSVAPAAVPASPSPGQCWIVGIAAPGVWMGHDGALACWTTGGWRFAAAFEGMRVWSVADGLFAHRTATGWDIGAERASSLKVGGQQVVGARQAAIPNPAGGSVADSEARVAISAILAALRAHGLIAA